MVNSAEEIEAVRRSAGMAVDFKPALRMKLSAIECVGRENRVVQISEHYLTTDKSAQRIGERDLKILATEL